MKKITRPRGAALIVVLSILVLVSGLVVGLAMAMRMERSASFYHLERLRADMLARQGVDYGHALLTSATTTNRFWVSGPGRIQASASNTFEKPSILINLSSGVTNSTNTNVAVDLNRYGWSGGDRLLNPGGTNFNVRWIYVLKNGSYDTNSTTVPTNAVGRFAFWVDDESTRVNLSTAHERNITTPTAWAAPSEISLKALPGMTDQYVSDIATDAALGAFNTPYEALGLTNGDIGGALSSNRFYITHYTQDPDVNPWGQDKIVLTTSQNLALKRNSYLSILSATNGNPGFLSGLDGNQVNTNLAKIMGRLAQTNWPYVSDKTASWVKKYGEKGAAQMALDIMEYVRSTESTNVFIEPLTATVTGTNVVYDSTLDFTTLGANSLIGTTRRPMISEMAVWLDAATNAASTNLFPGKLFVEVYLPPGYGVSSTNFPAAYTYHLMSSLNPVGTPVTPTITNGSPFVRFEQNIGVPPINTTDRPTNVSLRVALLKDVTGEARNILDVAPLAAGDLINYAVDGTNIIATEIHSVEVRDPRVNKYSTNWAKHALSNSLGTVNSQWTALIAPPPGLPEGDKDKNNVVTDISVQMAANGMVGSVGELGYINTGVVTNMPWRSVRLQPDKNATTNTLPDWALMDLFAAPLTNARYAPGTNLVSGRINLNALVADTNLSRTNVLNTLFTNTAVLNMATAVSNVISVTNLATGLNPGVSFGDATNNKIYSSVGQLVEVRGVADAGEESEQVIRQVASLATVRGDVFSIYSVGQALQVTKGGKTKINGEKMVRSIVERTLNASGVPEYKVIYWSEIYP